MAETTDKKQGNSDAGEAGKATRAAKPAKAARVSKPDEPDADQQVVNLLEGFTPEQVAALERTREAVQKGLYSDITNEHKKLLFVKWLVEHDKIAS